MAKDSIFPLIFAFAFLLLTLGAILVPFIQKNEELGLENYKLERKIEDLEHDLGYIDISLKECNSERFEWREYYGGLSGLESAREYYNTPAIDWTKFEISTTTM